jgi:hypothetical protein
MPGSLSCPPNAYMVMLNNRKLSKKLSENSIFNHKITLTPESSSTCLPTAWGVYYTGTMSKTRSGIPCQRWDTKVPHKHSYNHDRYFPYDGGLKRAANYCRNPDGKRKGVWCYTILKTKTWDYCNVPTCPPGKPHPGIQAIFPRSPLSFNALTNSIIIPNRDRLFHLYSSDVDVIMQCKQ